MRTTMQPPHGIGRTTMRIGAGAAARMVAGVLATVAIAGCASGPVIGADRPLEGVRTGVGPAAGGGSSGGTLVSTSPALPAGVVRVRDEAGAERLDGRAMVEASLARWADVRCYSAVMEKQEWLGGSLERTPHLIRERCVREPKCLHFHWIGEVNKGRHAVWKAGCWDDCMKIHPHPIFLIGTMTVRPDNPISKTQSNYDFRDGGMQGLMATLPDSLRPGGTAWTYEGAGEVAARPTWILRGEDPTTDPKKHNRMVMHIDQQTMLPAYFEGRNREDRLNLRVKFTDVAVNTGLCAEDFEPANVWQKK